MNIVNFTLDNETLGTRNLHSSRKSVNVFTKNKFRENIYESDNFTRKLPRILKENEFNLQATSVNKIFCSQWLDERRVLMGTKCNRVSLRFHSKFI